MNLPLSCSALTSASVIFVTMSYLIVLIPLSVLVDVPTTAATLPGGTRPISLLAFLNAVNFVFKLLEWVSIRERIVSTFLSRNTLSPLNFV